MKNELLGKACRRLIAVTCSECGGRCVDVWVCGDAQLCIVCVDERGRARLRWLVRRVCDLRFAEELGVQVKASAWRELLLAAGGQ